MGAFHHQGQSPAYQQRYAGRTQPGTGLPTQHGRDKLPVPIPILPIPRERHSRGQAAALGREPRRSYCSGHGPRLSRGPPIF